MVNLPSDIWGVACLLYELTAGHPVWHKHRHMSVPEVSPSLVCDTDTDSCLSQRSVLA